MRQLQKLNFKLKFLLYIGGFFFLQLIYSQEEKPLFYYIQNDKITQLDTSSLESFHEYRKDNAYLWLGNNGLDNYPLVFNQQEERKFLVSRFIGGFEVANKEYNVYHPFTSATYVLGARTEQYFNILHTQNFSKKGNFSLEYDKINAGGSYERQKVNNNNILASLNYTTPQNRYKLSFFAQRIQNTTEQNGGIANDSSFIIKSDLSLNRKTITVNLDSAYEQRIGNLLTLNQELELINKKDSLGIGSSHKLLSHTGFVNAKRFYTDANPDSEFYPAIYMDSLLTNDSIKTNQITQELSYQFKVQKENWSYNLLPYVKYEYLDYRHANEHQYYNDMALGVNTSIKTLRTDFQTQLNYYWLGYREGNYSWNTNLKYTINQMEWNIETAINKQAPSIDLQRYSGNHNSWQQTLIPVENYHFLIGGNHKKIALNAKVEYTDIKNPIYLNYKEEAVQTLDYTQVIKGEIEKEFQLKNWKLTPRLVYQHTGGAIVYRLPKYFTSLKAGYAFKAFKKSLAVFAGAKLTYYGNVQLMSYSPSLGAFYLANNNTVGNYPFVDFFVNTRIKNVRIFFALTHLNSGITSESNYFGAMHYPLEDRAYKIGINWNFLK